MVIHIRASHNMNEVYKVTKVRGLSRVNEEIVNDNKRIATPALSQGIPALSQGIPALRQGTPALIRIVRLLGSRLGRCHAICEGTCTGGAATGRSKSSLEVIGRHGVELARRGCCEIIAFKTPDQVCASKQAIGLRAGY
eukprot:3524981-Pyramimonas_sp.AAC.2